MNRGHLQSIFRETATVRFEPDQGSKADVIISSLGRAVYDSLVDMQSLAPSNPSYGTIH